MTVSDIAMKLIAEPGQSRHDVNHFMKVYAYAKTIAEREGLDADTRMILETAAIVHDIACPLCREKYGNTNGKYQELEGPPLVEELLRDSGLPRAAVDRIAYLVGHHHTLQNIDGLDHQILIEADYIVNADESRYSAESIRNALERVFRTRAGSGILKSLYL